MRKAKRVTMKDAAKFLDYNDNYVILAHQNPDGDAIGAAFALCHVLRGLGKQVNVLCSDDFPAKYAYITGEYKPLRFKHETIIAVDIADPALLGTRLIHYGDYVKLCIDHHKSNKDYAEKTLLDASAAAVCEILFELFREMGVTVDKYTAECLYTGITTDTGCFKYSCTTSRTHKIAAELLEIGADFDVINREMFDIKSKAQIDIERYISSSMEYYLHDKCALILLTKAVMDEIGVAPGDLEGISSLTLQLRGVELGVVIKERDDGKFRVSMRSASDADVSEICAKFGGGGHSRAAGCLMEGRAESIKLKLLVEIAPAFGMDLWTMYN